MWRGVSSWHLGDEPGVREAFGTAVELCDALVKKFPKAHWYKADLADVLGHRGDAWLRLGNVPEAGKSYDESQKSLRLALAASPDEVSYQVALAQTEERLAALAAREDKPEDVLPHRQKALQLWAELLQLEPNNLMWQAAAFRNLACTGQDNDAANRVDALVRKNPASPVLRLEAARCYAACAAAAAVPERRGWYVRCAVDAIRAARKAGYEGAFALRTDPDLIPLTEDEEFKTLTGLARR
jgi:predicted Zn-dependent protease